MIVILFIFVFKGRFHICQLKVTLHNAWLGAKASFFLQDSSGSESINFLKYVLINPFECKVNLSINIPY